MRVGVYDRYWSTGGGGERLALACALALADEHQVEVLGPGPIQPAVLGERLHLDLGAIGHREISGARGAAAAASADYDLFIACSYQHSEPSLAPHALYVTQFPQGVDPPPGRFRRRAASLGRRWIPSCDLAIEWGTGFHPDRGARTARRTRLWTMGDAVIRVLVPADTEFDLVVALRRSRPVGAGPLDIEVSIDGRIAHAGAVPTSRLARATSHVLRLSLPVADVDHWADVRFVSPTFVPAELGDSPDERELGIQIRGLRFVHRAQSHPARLWSNASELVALDHPANFLAGYDRIISISEYIRACVERNWAADSIVLHPPVTQFRAGPKQNEILAVGRFFPTDKGHSKNQLALVHAFRALVERGADDWTLHLVGGVSDEDLPYLTAVREAAAGLPVHFHIDASGAELAARYASATIFWHAAGLGADLDDDPAGAEHFGIVTAEAMSAGAVPVVFGEGGQREIVRSGVDGEHFDGADALVETTAGLIADPDRLDRLRNAARRRAASFAPPAFEQQLRAIVADTVG